MRYCHQRLLSRESVSKLPTSFVLTTVRVQFCYDVIVGFLWDNGPVTPSPFSNADMYQFAAIAAVAEMGGRNITSRFKWGRPDAPYMWYVRHLFGALILLSPCLIY